MKTFAVLIVISRIIFEFSEATEDLGCLEYTKEVKDSTGYRKIFDDGLTPEICNDLCFKRGYKYAATTQGKECICVEYDSGKPVPGKVSDSFCNRECNGDVTKKCGGDDVISVYQIITYDSLTIGKSLGCFDDDVENGILNQTRFELNNTNSPQKCLNMCQQLGFKFSGVKNLYECYCGNEFNIAESNRSLEIDRNECSIPCPGDPTQDCGWTFAISIYRIGKPEKLPDAGLAGCFTIQAGWESNYEETMGKHTTPLRCMSKCFLLGYGYAGIKHGTECHCRNSTLGVVSVNKSNCNYKCQGELHLAAGNCGGHNVISGYSLGLLPQKGEKLGCYKDQNTYPLLDGYKVDLISTNSETHCVTICYHLGFGYSGTRSGYKCLCGNTVPKTSETVSDEECNENCSGDQSQKCGANQRLSIYKTGLQITSNDVSGVCEKSPTIANGANVCKGAVIFKDTFVTPTQFSSKWHREVKFPDDDEYEFVTYTSDEEQLYVNNSKLIIKPTLLSDDIVVRGDLKLKGCTETPGSQHCERKAFSYLIIPPVKSASVSTKNSLNFKYGIVNIRAKVPAGDWIVPQFYLKPRYYSYGPLYKSGIIRIGTVKGNQNLVCNNQSYGINYVENGILLGDGMSVKAKTMKTFSKKPWNTQFHNYTLYWSPDEIKFSIDNLQVTKLYPDGHPVLGESVGFTPEQSEIWKQGSGIAPFDKEFYLSIGVSVGGMREFDDNCISGETYKPWKNTEVKAMFKFWQNRMEWNKKTWGEKSVLEVENVVITAI